ncbi:MAG: group II intron reverse transcriptase/maturase [Pirellulaceae bacterium]|nr:MAG: group II intron reverse transcriptase/maturase [Pirellulaceae bacterium]
MTRNTEHPPPAVPQGATRSGEAPRPQKWAWAKPWIWKGRMLSALETGVKGGRWYSLIDKVYASRTLQEAARWVTRDPHKAAGVDHVTPEQYAKRMSEETDKLAEQLQDGTYRPQAIRRVYIPKPGSQEKRPLGIPTIRDRVVQAALRYVIEPIFERDFAEHSYGFRPGRSTKDALRRVDKLLKEGYRYIVDADLKSYFDTIPHDRLLARVGQKISDGRILGLIKMFLEQGVMEGLSTWTPEEGTPQGAIISPLLANIYLDPLDHLMAEKGFQMVRYADDFVILCRTREEAEQALALVRQWTEEAGLQLHPTKTRIATHEEGFDFLGYHFRLGKRAYRFPREKSLKKVYDTIRAKTRRTDGRPLTEIIADVNRTLRGWFEYYKHSTKTVFPKIDQWVRMRLRSILRRRRKGKGRGRGRDHLRWPNAFFGAHGLFDLTTAHSELWQSSRR